MKSHRIDLTVLLQVVLLAVTPALFILTLDIEALIITRITLAIIWLIQMALLYRYLKRSENSLRQAVKIISSGDESHFLRNRHLSRVHEDVLDEINNAISVFRDLKIENEANLRFFQQVMQHVPAGVFVVNSDETIEFINSSAKDLFGSVNLRILKDLDSVKKGLTSWFRDIKGAHNVMDIDFPDRSYKISVSVRQIRVREETQTIYSFKDIKKEVDIRELETWHNMLRILSHEVVNSVSPITLSAMGMQRNIADLKGITPENDDYKRILSEIDTGLSAISERGKGLNEFVESVQRLTRIPEPSVGPISLRQLAGESVEIMKTNLRENNIRLEEDLADIKIYCDKRLISHVMINLVKNSIESFSSQTDKTIRISGKKTDAVIIIQVEDNGPGIPGNIRNQVFSPFFSTKRRGSGLGLSFSRQVMQLHKGNINVWSEPGKTIFTLTLPVNPDAGISGISVV